MNKNDIISCQDIITKSFSNIEKSCFQKNDKLSSTWEKIVTRIRSYNSDENIGQNLFEHSHVIEIKNNILLVEADHPGWIQMLQLNKKFILRGLSMYVPELKISSLAFRLKGSNATLCTVNYDKELSKETEKMKNQIKNEEEILKSYDNKKAVSQENSLPPELLQKFKELQESSRE